jgi:hypothetical protein
MNIFKTGRRTYSFGLMLSIVGILISLARIGAPSHKQSPGFRQTDAETSSSATPPQSGLRTTEHRTRDYGKLPLSFESNQGQTDKTVNFLARGSGYSLFLASTEATFVLSHQSGAKTESLADELPKAGVARIASSEQTAVLRMQLVGGNRNAEVKGDDELAGKVNYFVGNDPTKWRTNVPTFSRVRYSDVYQGIDLVYYGNQRHLEYDFVVGPGRDARAIALEFAGAQRVEVEAKTGDLLLRLAKNTIRQQRPLVYQDLDGGRQQIESRYAIKKGGQVGFEVGEYDRSAPLIIDPVLLYSTYLGGGGDEIGYDIALDSTGNTYIAGSTTSTNFPTAGAFQSTATGGLDAFVTKLNAAGSALVYSTYLGGSGGDVGLAIAVDSAGNAYVTGVTSSTTFPTANARQATTGGFSDAFVTKLNAAGSALVYSTYLGGSGNESGFGIAVDSAGNAYITGPTQSFNFPTANALQGTKGDASTSNNDVFISKLNAAGSALTYSTYLGGLSDEKPGNIAVDSAGSAYIAGVTFSNNFPTANALQGTIKGSLDAFVTKINAAGSALVYSSYLGGTVTDQANRIAVDSAGNAYVTGATNSDDFPTANALQSTKGRFNDVFVTKLNATGSALVYSTFVGGSDDEFGFGLALDSTGNAYVTGGTKSTDFPAINALQGTKAGDQDTYVMKLNAAGSALVYSTFLGGTGFDEGHKIAVDGVGNAYVTGTTFSSNFPTTTGAFRTTLAGTSDAFVTKIGDLSTVQFSASLYTVGEGDGFRTITVERTGNTSSAMTVDYLSSDHSNPADFISCTSPGAGLASSRCDFTTAVGTLRFAAGETSKTFDVLISQDNYVEGPETLDLTLSNPTGGIALGTPATTTLRINDDATEPATNFVDVSSAFVRSQYHDFLKREPDTPGLAFWTDNIEKCNDPARRPAGQTAAQCIDKQRESTAVAFFMSPEFQITGGFVYHLYKGSLTGSPNYDGGSPGRFPTSLEFMRDLATVSEGIVVNNAISGAVVEANRNRLAAEFVLRPEFLAKYGALNNILYVQELFNTTGTAATAAEKQALVDGLTGGTETKASVLRKVVDGTVVISESNVQFTTTYGQAFINQENRRVFVYMEYIGYLRRNPDAAGFIFWLGKLNFYNGDPFQAEMVRAFILSPEYRSRFGQP